MTMVLGWDRESPQTTRGREFLREFLSHSWVAPQPTRTPCRILTQLRHPRINIFGGSLNYFLQDAGALLRFETTFTPNAPFTESDLRHRDY